MHAAHLLLTALLAHAPPAASAGEVHVAYKTYAAGLDVARVEAAFDLGKRDYAMKLAYQTTGLVGFFYHARHVATVQGAWQHGLPAPHVVYGAGLVAGKKRLTEIDYHHGMPQVLALEPPDGKHRQPVPAGLQAHSMDTLSALALLMRRVAETGKCEASVRTYDGRRAFALQAHTAEEDILPRTNRSIYSGRALRCDFTEHLLAGFKLDGGKPAHHKPLHGSVWFAAALAGAPPLPVRIQVSTTWFGAATMYLTAAGPGPALAAQR